MSDSKKSAWNGYRSWRKFSWTIFPAIIGMEMFPQVWPVFAILLIYGLYCGFKIQFFSCPSCGEFFFINPKFPRFYWPWFGTCMNCGFPKWEEPPPKPPTVDLHPIPRDENPNRNPAIAEHLRQLNFLTLVLRDDPGSIGLRLDPQGWADADHLVARANRYDVKPTRESLGDIASDSKNHHFDWDPAGNRVRWRKS